MKSMKWRMRLYGMGVAMAVAASAAMAVDVTVTDVTARQRYPWNGLVDIDFEVECDDPETNLYLYVSARDEGTGKAFPVRTVKLEGGEFGEELVVKAGNYPNGKGRLVWDAGADVPGTVSDSVSVSLSMQTVASRIYMDSATNYANDWADENNGWTDGSNGGTGFGAWHIEKWSGSYSDGWSGYGIWDPSANEFEGNWTGKKEAFGLVGKGDGWGVTASRSFIQPLSLGDSFSFEWAVNWDPDVYGERGAIKGFVLTAEGKDIVVINHEGNGGDISVNGNRDYALLNAYGRHPMVWTFTVVDATHLQFTATCRDNPDNVCTGILDVATAALDGFRLQSVNQEITYDSAENDWRQSYFDNFQLFISGVPKRVQELEWAEIGTQLPGNRVALAAVASGGGTVVYDVLSGPGLIEGDILTPTGAGTIEVRATQAGDAVWAAASATQRVVVSDVVDEWRVHVDLAANYANNWADGTVANGWTDGSNKGTGFEAWHITKWSGYYDGWSGCGIWDPSSNEFAGTWSAKTEAFGLVGTGDGWGVTASRSFSQPLSFGDSFSFEWAVNWDSGADGTHKGFALTADGKDIVVVNHEGNGGDISVNGNRGYALLNAYGRHPMTWTFTVVDATHLQFTATCRDNPVNVCTGLLDVPTAAIDGFRLQSVNQGITYDSAENDWRQSYFDNFRLFISGVPKRVQELEWAEIGTQLPGNRVALAAVASGGGTVAYEVLSGPGIIEGNVLTPTGAGTIEVRATQAGDAVWAAVSATQCVVVAELLDGRRVHVDLAANYANNWADGTVANGWTDGSNKGTGFEAWHITKWSGYYDGWSGCGIWDPCSNEFEGNWIGKKEAFGLVGKGEGWGVTASRSFIQPLSCGNSFSFEWAVNWDPDVYGERGATKGFVLTAEGKDIVVVNHEGNGGDISVNGNRGYALLNAYGRHPMAWTFTVVDATHLEFTATGRDNPDNVCTGILDVATAAIDGFRLQSVNQWTADETSEQDYRQSYFDDFRLFLAEPEQNALNKSGGRGQNLAGATPREPRDTDSSSAQSAVFRLDTRKGVRLVSGAAEHIALSGRWNGLGATFSVDGETIATVAAGEESVAEWVPVEIGRHVLEHASGGVVLKAEFSVVGENVEVHAGSVSGNETWAAGKVHVVDGMVTVGRGAMLTIESGAVVKFTDGSELAISSGGACVANGVVFTHIADDSVGGDTAGDGTEMVPTSDSYGISGSVQMDGATEVRYLTVKTSGTISRSTTWLAHRVIHVTGDVTVGSGAILTVEPGAVVKFAPGASLKVNRGGTLNAIGMRAQPIVFTSMKDDDYGGDTNGDGNVTEPQPGDWGCVLISGGTIKAEYCRFTYGSGVDGNEYGARACVFMWNGGAGTFDGCLFSGSLMDGCFAQNATFRNCIFTDCDRGLVSHTGTIAAINCVAVHNCIGFFSHTSPLVVHNSISALNHESAISGDGGSHEAFNCYFGEDPKFFDADNGDFRLQMGSPCIDAGDGRVAPESDWWGQPRMDVADVANTGTAGANGAVPDIGIHEVLPRVVSSDVDLAVTGVEAPGKLTVGETAVITWRVKNEGVAGAAGPWTDVVELVGANGAVATLGRVAVAGGLVAGGERVFEGEFKVPASAIGRGHVRVTANGDRDLFEGTLTVNNVGESEVVEVDLPELAVGGGASVSLEVGGGVATAFRVPQDAASGGGVLVIRTGGKVMVQAGAEVVPTADIYHAMGVQIAADTWVVALPEGVGAVYATVENEGPSPMEVEVSVASGALLLFETGAVSAPNEGLASLALCGYGFADGMEFWIEKDGTRKGADEVVVTDTVRATATFDVSGLAEGTWTVHAKRGGNEASAALLTLTETRTGPKWSCNLDVPSTVRSGREYVGYVEYGNSGDMPLNAPYVKLSAKSGTLLRFGASDVWGDTLEMLATSETYPASQLKPGETRRVPFRYKTTGTSLSIEYSYTLSDDGTFPWTAISSLMRPSWASDELWGLAKTVLQKDIKGTWNDYLGRLREVCDHLGRIGKMFHQITPIWQLEVNEALGVDYAIPTLASSTDLARNGRGFGLVLTRSYGSALYQRLKKGVFGYGWSDNYAVWAELQNGGATLALHSGSGSTYRFEKVNGKWTPEVARDKTVLTENASEYVLTYRNGTVQRMSKDNMRISSVKDNQGNELSFTYNADGTLARVRHTDGQTLSFTYANGLLVSASDDHGRTTRYDYSGGLLTKATAFNGLETRYRYFSADGSATSRALRQIVYPDGTTRDYTYDALGRVATVAVNGTQLITEIVRDALGSYTVIAPDGGRTEVTVGASGEVLEMVNALGQRVTCSYTEDTLLESVVGPTGKRAKIAYDEEGQAVRATDASGAETLMDYTADFGNLAKVTDARGNSFGYGYDKLGRPASIAYADGAVDRVFRNARGDITNSVNRRGQVIAISHDGEGNVVSMEWEDGRTFTWAYDAKGNVTNATDSVTGAVTMEYDGNERLARIVYPKGRGFTYAYDGVGRMTERRSLDGSRECFAYDALGRLATVSDGMTVVLSNAYDAVTGRLATQTYGNGTVVSNAYDALGRIVGITHWKDGKRLAFFEYTYDAEGKCVSQSTAEGVETYRYDIAGQLTGVTYPDGTKESFVYDAVGNRVEANGGEYAVNAMNQYTALSGGTGDGAVLAYDLDGNLASVTDAEGTTTYAYDSLNRLVGVTNEEKGIRWSCEYDVFGNRTSVTDNGTTTERLYLQGALPSVAAEYVDGALMERHILAGAVRVADVAPGGAVRYCHGDLLGSVRLVTDGTGAIVGSQSFKAFGETRVAAGDTGGAGYVGMLGVEVDSTGLLFMRNRYYSAGMGRFVQMDPIGLNAGDVNVYRYCRNNGVEIVDPNGCTDAFCVPAKLIERGGELITVGSAVALPFTGGTSLITLGAGGVISVLGHGGRLLFCGDDYSLWDAGRDTGMDAVSSIPYIGPLIAAPYVVYHWGGDIADHVIENERMEQYKLSPEEEFRMRMMQNEFSANGGLSGLFYH